MQNIHLNKFNFVNNINYIKNTMVNVRPRKFIQIIINKVQEMVG